jgi:hypothetical protein
MDILLLLVLIWMLVTMFFNEKPLPRRFGVCLPGGLYALWFLSNCLRGFGLILGVSTLWLEFYRNRMISDWDILLLFTSMALVNTLEILVARRSKGSEWPAISPPP